jgi:hypothetical protein
MKKIAFIIILIVGLACSSVYASGARNLDPNQSIALGISDTPTQKCSSAVRIFTDTMNWLFCPETEGKE